MPPILPAVSEKRRDTTIGTLQGASTVVRQTFAALGINAQSTEAHFNEKRTYRIFVAPALKQAYDTNPAAERPIARISLFFGVDPELNLFGLRKFFSSSRDEILITVPGVEKDWPGYGPRPWGIGITDEMIRDLLREAAVDGLPFKINAMAGYSTGYRGMNLTIINKLVGLASLSRIVYFDAFYQHDDFPRAATTSPYFRRNTRRAIDTALVASPSAQVVIYGFTHPGGTPRTGELPATKANPPTGPLEPALRDHGSNIRFVDLEFPYAGRLAIADSLNKICLARLVEAALGDYISEQSVGADVLGLTKALPARGSFGTLGRSGFTDLYAWLKAKPQANLIAGFPAEKAFALIKRHKLLSDWSADVSGSAPLKGHEFRHRVFVQEIGKEALIA